MNRRTFVSFAMPAAVALPAAARSAVRGARARITDVRLVRLRTIREVGQLEPAWNPGGRMSFREGGGTFTEILTDQGISGIGPGVPDDLVARVKEQLVGADPFDTERHSARLSYYAHGSAYRGSGNVDIAIWDVIGKLSGQPLYKLWGGAKDSVPAYASMVQLSTPEERARLAATLADQGWTAIKLRLHHASMEEDIRTVEEVKKATNGRMDILTDGNQAQSSGGWQPGVRWDFRRALETARELERLGCFLLEEPLPRYAFDQLAELNRLVALPIAGGENNSGLHEFREMLERGVYDILQPESLVTGGITVLRKIGVLAEAFGKRVMPHHGGRSIGTIAHLHLVASWRHSPYLELLHDPPIGDHRHAFSIFQEPPRLDRSGHVPVPQAPGLGVEINPDLIARS
jgi:D-galactarolactone cycloisomerase